MNTDAKISLQYFSILWGIYLEVELLDHIIIRLIFFRNHNTTYPFWLSFLVCIMGLLWGLIWKDYNQCCAVLRSLLLCQTLVLLTLLIGLDPKGHPSPAHCQDFHSPVLSSIKFKWLLQGHRFWFTCSCLSLVFILKKGWAKFEGTETVLSPRSLSSTGPLGQAYLCLSLFPQYPSISGGSTCPKQSASLWAHRPALQTCSDSTHTWAIETI